MRLLDFLSKQKGRRAPHSFSYIHPFGVFFMHLSFYYHPFMTNSAVIFIAKNNFKSSPHPQEEILSSGWQTEPQHRNSLIPSTVPSKNSSKSEKVTLCLIPVWLVPYSSRWLQWWLHPLNSTFKPGLYFSPTVCPAVLAEVESVLEDQQHWSGDALLQQQGKGQLMFPVYVTFSLFYLHNNIKMNKPLGPCAW